MQMVYGQNQATLQCGATVIDPLYVITAAHCVEPTFEGLTLSQVHLYGGLHTLSSTSGSQLRYASTIYRHPDYNAAGQKENDFAVIRVHSPFTLEGAATGINVACMPEPGSVTTIITTLKY